MPKMQRRPDPPPLDTDDRPVVLVGIALWAVAFVVLLAFFRHNLHRHHATYWLWSCAIGVALGLYGLHFIRKRRHGPRRTD